MAERDYPRRRRKLVDHLRSKGIENALVLKAISNVKRHLFIESAFLDRAYDDVALPIGLKQTISQPLTVATQSQLLDPQKGDKVLEIGTGSGYQAAILCEMGLQVYSIERHGPLLQESAKRLHQLGYRLMTKHSDGSIGWAAFGPYDGIVVTAGAVDVPQPLLKDLRLPEDGKRGGRLVIPIGDSELQTMFVFERLGPEEFQKTEAGAFKFVPMIGSEGGHRQA